eukprot:4606180-Lingulodinium_polyedra.AAC.1
MRVAQHSAGRHFLFERPATALSRRPPRLQRLAASQGIYSMDVNACCFGMEVTVPNGKGVRIEADSS